MGGSPATVGDIGAPPRPRKKPFAIAGSAGFRRSLVHATMSDLRIPVFGCPQKGEGFKHRRIVVLPRGMVNVALTFRPHWARGVSVFTNVSAQRDR